MVMSVVTLSMMSAVYVMVMAFSRTVDVVHLEALVYLKGPVTVMEDSLIAMCVHIHQIYILIFGATVGGVTLT